MDIRWHGKDRAIGEEKDNKGVMLTRHRKKEGKKDGRKGGGQL